ncbi:GNAT family N-acetyltransferase [Balneolales bacterium ANBcel1]|nr:GNAT family N-acetyltransferase [Balneolales bacterium ANBcel1]
MSKLSIEFVEAAVESEWQQVWMECEYATFFHSPEWLHIVKEYSGGSVLPVTRKITFSDGTSAFFILSATKNLKGLVKVYESSPLGVYGGWISTHALSDAHAAMITSLVMKQYPGLIWRASPFQPHDAAFPVSGSLKQESTFVVPLNMPFDELRKKIRRNTLRNLKKAESLDLSLKKIEARHLPAYYDCYRQSLERWQGKGSPKSHYGMEMFQQLLQSEYCDFFGVFHGGKLVCGGPILRSRRHAVSWLGLADADYIGKGVYQYFYYHLIRHYRVQGFAWFDFNPSSSLKGVEHFKKGFATVAMPAPVMDTRSSYVRGLQKIRRYFDSGINS